MTQLLEKVQSAEPVDRVRLLEDVRRLLFDEMKKAREACNWEMFGRYVDAYCSIVG